MEATKSIYCAKSDGTVDQITVIRWLKKFLSACKKHDDQVRSGKLKTVDFEAVIQAIEVNPASSIWRRNSISPIPVWSIIIVNNINEDMTTTIYNDYQIT